MTTSTAAETDTFDRLPREYPRRFVPQDLDLGDWSAVEPLYDDLDRRPIADRAELERWLQDWSELTSCLDQEKTLRYARMSCNTEDPEREAAYKQYVEHIAPKLAPRHHAIEVRYLAERKRLGLPEDLYGVLDRLVGAEVRVYREKNIPLRTRQALLGQRYQQITGAMTVEYEGEERTLPQMARYLEEQDRGVREQTWRLVSDRRLQDAGKLDDIFDELLECRFQVAANADFADYRDYIFVSKRRFDYGWRDCLEFHAAIEEVAVPIVARFLEERRRDMGLAALRPWDTAVDPLGRPRLVPFDKGEQLVDKVDRIFESLDAELAAQYRRVVELGLIDVESRKGKAPGGYMAALPEDRLPFIFMNAAGRDGDVRTLLHEAGHAFHTLAAREQPFFAYRYGPMEFNEVASMAMEHLGAFHLDQFYSGEDLVRARHERLLGVIQFFPWMAIVDGFQHWIYTHPGHTRQERTEAWRGLMGRFGAGVDWTGLEEHRDNLWHRQLHVFLYPFYYVEYGIAELGALGVWLNGREDRSSALAAYKRALALGGSRPLPELFDAAGVRFDFSAGTLRRILGAVVEEIESLDE